MLTCACQPCIAVHLIKHNFIHQFLQGCLQQLCTLQGPGVETGHHDKSEAVSSADRKVGGTGTPNSPSSRVSDLKFNP